MSGVVNVGGGESRGGECRTILQPYHEIIPTIREMQLSELDRDIVRPPLVLFL